MLSVYGALNELLSWRFRSAFVDSVAVCGIVEDFGIRRLYNSVLECWSLQSGVWLNGTVYHVGVCSLEFAMPYSTVELARSTQYWKYVTWHAELAYHQHKENMCNLSASPSLSESMEKNSIHHPTYHRMYKVIIIIAAPASRISP